MKSFAKKVGIAVGTFAVAVGVAFAAFSFTIPGTLQNEVTAGSPGIQITASPIEMDDLTQGGSTPPNEFKIKNTGDYTGNAKLNLTSVTGNLCPDLTLTISGDASGSFAPVANGSLELGTIAPGATMTLIQVVTMADPSVLFGQTCTWNETVTFYGG